jgi:excisionase family DNA binding protein
MAPKVYSVAQVLDMTGIGRATLYRQIAAGLLKAHKIGRRTVILADDYQAWLESAPTL